jgi:hypothetical protein
MMTPLKDLLKQARVLRWLDEENLETERHLASLEFNMQRNLDDIDKMRVKRESLLCHMKRSRQAAEALYFERLIKLCTTGQL